MGTNSRIEDEHHHELVSGGELRFSPMFFSGGSGLAEIELA